MTENTAPTVQEPQVRRTDRRFEIHVDDSGQPAGFTLYRDYTTDGGSVQRIVPHTEVKDEFEGHGLASTLVREALDLSVAEGVAIVPVCPYVKNWIEKHDGYAEHVVKTTPDHLQFLSGR